MDNSEFQDIDEEFFDFLMKTKESLARLSQDSDTQENTMDEESAFLRFIADLKKDLPTVYEEKKNPTISFSSRNASPVIKQRSLSIPDSERLSSKQDGKTKSKSMSNDISIILNEMENEAEKDFKRNRVLCTNKLYHFFNKKIFNSRLPEDMPVEWSDNLRTTAGYTHCRRNDEEYSCRIELSTKVVTSFDRLRDTLLHEMCHAAVWLVNKQRCQHGPLWQTWASRCNLILPQIQVPTRCHDYQISYRFIYKCRKCNWKAGRHSKCPRLLESKCPNCGGSTYLEKS
ncbi:acidic repeat-containing protein [Trichonephila inaurata madagascariensis]|uniref:Acidic repeat-containing protein n=1 Tax=Trichonephila inaurata madagascariensis TaxID=2747483 RepID=A0A8X6IIH2_9ARAC|nr:acidic repeat-containing protein [Trichonephila inaurata madagascariensis]